MESMPGLLAMVRLRQGSELYVVVDEDYRHRRVNLMSITGKQVLLCGVSLAAILEAVEGPPAKVNPPPPHAARRRRVFSCPGPGCWLQHDAGRFLSGGEARSSSTCWNP